MSIDTDALAPRHPLHHAELAHGVISWREAGRGPALVLLHGIGSGALGWAAQFEAFAPSHRVLAWDAPGYGSSAPLPQAQPAAADYGRALFDWLRAVDAGPCVLVGHSLGAIVAASAAAAASDGTVQALVLASPALGYGDAAPELRAARKRERVDLIRRLGPQGLAEERAARLCTPAVPPGALDLVRWNMARVTPQGYEQAAHLLTHETLSTYAARVKVPLAVLCGELDSVTPAAASAAFARSLGAPFHAIAGAAHACYVEHAQAFNRALQAVLDPIEQVSHD